jgi:hypothetical protein
MPAATFHIKIFNTEPTDLEVTMHFPYTHYEGHLQQETTFTSVSIAINLKPFRITAAQRRESHTHKI